MYKALYDYKSSLQGYLTFKSGDQFTIIDGSRSDWYLAQNGFGEVGYIPHNYIAKETVPLQEILKFIDRSIEAINYESTQGSGLTRQLREDLNKLLAHRTNIIQEFSKGPNAVPISSGRGSTKKSSLKRGAPPPPTSTADSVHEQHAVPEPISHANTVSCKPAQSSTRSDIKDNYKEIRGPQNAFSGSTEKAPAPPTRSSSIKQNETVDSPSVSLPNGTTRCDGALPPPGAPSLGAEIPQNVVDIQDSDITENKLPLSPPSKSLPSSPSRNFTSSSVINVKTIAVPPNFSSEIVDEVRKQTGLSYDKSCVAVEVVLSHVANRIPQTAGAIDKILASFQESGDDHDTEVSHDATQIEHLLSQLSACKDDAQQRSWALHEDQQLILGYLEELLSILENAKVSICRKAVAKDGYEGIHNLVEYYQMETRTVIRLSALKVFGVLCGLDAAVISHLLYSVLPLELINEIQTNYSEVQRLSYVGLVLTMVLCTGEPVPVNLQEQLSEDFIDFTFSLVENPPSLELQEQAEDVLVSLILTINLQYDDHLTNKILNVIEKRGTVKTFTEKLLLIFNRGDDPVKMFDHQNLQTHSVLKFLIDIYSRQSTSSLLYTNDAKVLIDITLRQLVDLPTGDQGRSEYLKLMYLFVKNSDYCDYKYRVEELCHCLQSISEEEEEQGANEEDKQVSINILQLCWQNIQL